MPWGLLMRLWALASLLRLHRSPDRAPAQNAELEGLEESKKITQSLSYLGNVIAALTDSLMGSGSCCGGFISSPAGAQALSSRC